MTCLFLTYVFLHPLRLNNVIWRCWHMQFVKGQRRLLCAFANPLDIDYHNCTEGSTLLEGKYWKRKLVLLAFSTSLTLHFLPNSTGHSVAKCLDNNRTKFSYSNMLYALMLCLWTILTY